MSDTLQRELDRMYEIFKDNHPEYNYNQLESLIYSFLSSQMSKFRHRTNNPEQYTGLRYDPEGQLRIQEEEDVDYDVVFFSSKIHAC